MLTADLGPLKRHCGNVCSLQVEELQNDCSLLKQFCTSCSQISYVVTLTAVFLSLCSELTRRLNLFCFIPHWLLSCLQMVVWSCSVGDSYPGWADVHVHMHMHACSRHNTLPSLPPQVATPTPPWGTKPSSLTCWKVSAWADPATVHMKCKTDATYVHVHTCQATRACSIFKLYTQLLLEMDTHTIHCCIQYI